MASNTIVGQFRNTSVETACFQAQKALWKALPKYGYDFYDDEGVRHHDMAYGTREAMDRAFQHLIDVAKTCKKELDPSNACTYKTILEADHPDNTDISFDSDGKFEKESYHGDDSGLAPNYGELTEEDLQLLDKFKKMTLDRIITRCQEVLDYDHFQWMNQEHIGQNVWLCSMDIRADFLPYFDCFNYTRN